MAVVLPFVNIVCTKCIIMLVREILIFGVGGWGEDGGEQGHPQTYPQLVSLFLGRLVLI